MPTERDVVALGGGGGWEANSVHCEGYAYPEVNSRIYLVYCFGRKVMWPNVIQPMS